MKKTLSALLLSLAAVAACAQATPVGLWKTIDDETKQEKSLVRISESGGALSGKVDKVMDATKQDAVCDLCTDARKGKLVLGMTIIDGVKKHATEPYWDGGSILDPNNGKVYKVRMTPKDGGKLLEVRGFIGPFYRNQQWIRVE